MTVRSKIHNVRLFQKGARITRQLEIPSSGHFSLHNLSPFLHDDSIRFSLSAGLRLKNHTVHLELAKTEGLNEAQQELFAKETRKKDLLEEQQRELQKELHFWENQRIPAQPKDRDGVPVDSRPELLLGALELQSERIQQLQRKLQKLKQASKKQYQALAPLQFLISKEARSLNTPKITKKLDLEVEGEGSIEVSYFCEQAAWYPCYTLKLSSDYQKAQLFVEAQIWQETGEDWEGVNLSLSTASIQQNYDLPKLQSRRIGRQEHFAKKPWIPPPVGTEKLFADYDAFSKGPNQPLPGAEEQLSEIIEEIPLDLMMDEAEEEYDDFALDDITGEQYFEGATGGAAPQAETPRNAPMPPPMMQAAPAPMAKKGSMFGGMSLSRSAAPPPPRGAGKMRKKKSRKPRPKPTIQVAKDDLMDFHNIRLMNLDHKDRGFLTIHKETSSNMPSQVYEPTKPKEHTRPAPPLHFDYIYKANHPVSLPSGHQFRKIQLSEEQAENQLVYISIPSKSQQVFRQIRLRNPLSAPILKGPVDVYSGRSFLMQSNFDNTPSGGLFRFDLGVESNIRISRNLQSKESVQGMFIKEKEVQNAVQFEIKNALSQTITLELLEVLPTAPEDSDIKIQNVKATPDWNIELPKDNPKGSKGWSFTIEPKTTQDSSYSYSIIFPTNKELVGGNRRGSQ